MFNIPQQGESLPEEKPIKESTPKAPRLKAKCDPRLVSAARELRDRYLDQVNGERLLPGTHGKYDVSRLLDMPTDLKQTPLLKAA